jgi:hypothetical protein
MSDLGTEMRIVESYTPNYREWKTLPPMSIARAYVGVAVLDGYLYTVGGWNEENGALNTVERYSIEQVSFTAFTTIQVLLAS